jgi:hypothetical protein
MQNEFNEVELTVNELKALLSIIEVASSRGTFKANELSSVGKVYDRLAIFLNKIVVQNETQHSKSPENTQV